MGIRTTSPNLHLSNENETFAEHWRKNNGNNAVGEESNAQKLQEFCNNVVADLTDISNGMVDIDPFAVHATDVTNLAFNDSTNTLTWNAPDTSKQRGTTTLSYKVYLDGSLQATTSNRSYTFSSLTGGNHIFKVQAVWSVVFTPQNTATASGAQISYGNTEKLATPTITFNISQTVGTLAIGNVPYASGYALTVKKGSSVVHSETFASSGNKTIGYSFELGNNYTVEVKANGSTFYIESNIASASKNYIRQNLAAPNIARVSFTESGNISVKLDEVPGATTYYIEVVDTSENTVASGNYGTHGTKELVGSFVLGDTYTVRAYAVSTNMDYTELSATSTKSSVYNGASGGSNAVSFATDSWAVVSEEAKRIAQYFDSNGAIPDDTPYKVGDTREMRLSTNEVATIAIMGFCHDEPTNASAYGASKVGITIGMADSLATTANMNSSATNSGGWTSSAMRSRMATYLAQLTETGLSDAIVPVQKKTSAGNMSSAINTTSDSLWLFSLEEVHGTIYRSSGNQRVFSGEGAQYEYFKKAPLYPGCSPLVSGATSGTCVANGNSITTRLGNNVSPSNGDYINKNSIKGNGHNPTSSSSWWLRSPNSNYSSGFVYVYSSGDAGYNGANGTYGVSFGFCL